MHVSLVEIKWEVGVRFGHPPTRFVGFTPNHPSAPFPESAICLR